MTDDPWNTDPNASEDRAAEPVDEAVARYVDDLTAGRPVDPMQVLVENPGIGHAVLKRLEEFVGLREGDQVQAALGTLGDYTLRRQIGRGGILLVLPVILAAIATAIAGERTPGATVPLSSSLGFDADGYEALFSSPDEIHDDWKANAFVKVMAKSSPQ